MSAVTSIPTAMRAYQKMFRHVQLHRVSEVEEVIRLLDGTTSEDLIVFDVDEVLITPKDRFLRPCAAEHSDPFFLKTFYPLSDQHKLRLFGEWISQVEVDIVNQKLVDALRGIQNKGVRTMGLTRMIPGPGRCGKIPSMEDFRYFELKARGIDFSQSFSIDRIELDFTPKEGRTPLFKDGILYALPYAKGEVLKSFLKQTDYHPRKILFVDNDQYQVDDVAESISALSIPYIGIQYLDKLLVEEAFDQQLGEFQFQYFEKTEIWLSDSAAREKMKR